MDIGGTGIKAAIVDLEAGTLLSDRIKVATPQGAEPKDVLAAVHEVLEKLDVLDDDDPARGRLPGDREERAHAVGRERLEEVDRLRGREVLRGRPRARHPLRQRRRCRRRRRGALRRGAGHASGLTILTTLGTGIGSAFIYNGVLIPNSELGHLQRAEHKRDVEE